MSVTRPALFVLLLALTSATGASCNLVSNRKVVSCPQGTSPCGNGCIPPTGVCCDDGSGKTSSYCTNQATGCAPNDRGCQAVFPAGVEGAFCCGTSGSIGSNDCPAGELHCGLLCQSKDKPCCPAGASKADCPTMTWDESGCSSTKPGRVGCAVCTEKKQCISCATGSCCSGDPCGEHPCVPGAACVGTTTGSGTGAGGGSSGPCDSFTAADCCASTAGTKTTACALAPPCTCPSGTTFVRVQTDGNTLCACP